MIPAAMVGTHELTRGRLWPRPGTRPGVRFGKPLDFSRYCGGDLEQPVMRAVTDEIMHALRELSGQEYVDEYAPKARRRRRAGRGLPASDRPLDRGAGAEPPEVTSGSDPDGS